MIRCELFFWLNFGGAMLNYFFLMIVLASPATIGAAPCFVFGMLFFFIGMLCSYIEIRIRSKTTKT